MKNNLKENTKLRCKDSPRKEDIWEDFWIWKYNR
ncbi:MAG: hypothetical protein Ta2E_03820 [Mycoplasmoidaceae bacterium]|nr:MAG: hypothetical protein Ta2E_03820 [Mycoplasmoidaceae bacterium]